MFASRNNYFKNTLLLAAVIFLFLTVGAEFLHNHGDSEFHGDCPACIWLFKLVVVLSVFILFLNILFNFGCIPLNALCVTISKSYQAFRYLRSPPSVA